LDKRLVHWDKVHPAVLEKLEQLKQEGLVIDDGAHLSLTKLGWYWYVNIMYYLMPKEDQLVMNRMVVDKLKNPGRTFVKRELFFPVIPIKATA
jgi:oxygen-independent coproporphyrinogen-3 oxidase